MTHGEAMSVRATCPIGINQASQVRMHISVEVNASTKGTFKLTQNALNSLKVSITWILHKVTDLLN